MRVTPFGCVFLCMVMTCYGQDGPPLCPKHIETPDYPAIGRTAHLTGEVILAVTIDAEGRVTQVEASTDNSRKRAHPMLQKLAVENMQRWTFSKPPTAPYTETIVYDYEFDATLPGYGGRKSMPTITKVKFDLPDRVTILTNVMFIETDKSRAPN